MSCYLILNRNKNGLLFLFIHECSEQGSKTGYIFISNLYCSSKVSALTSENQNYKTMKNLIKTESFADSFLYLMILLMILLLGVISK
jgi:hypothetical protein